MAITLTCPQCGALYEDLDDSMLGTEVQCHCSHVFIANPDRPKGQPNVVKVNPQTQSPAPQQPPKQPNFQPASAAAAGMTGSAKKTPPRPVSQKPRRNSGVKIVNLVVFAVLGCASAFGVLSLMGVFDNDAPPNPGPQIADNDPTPSDNGNAERPKTPDNDGGNNQVNVRNPVEPPPADSGQPVAVNDPPLDPVAGNPDVEPGENQVVSGPMPYSLLEVEPFDRTMPATAQLHDQVQAGISTLMEARKSLAMNLDELVVTLAAEGELDELDKVRQAKLQVERDGDSSGLNNLTNESVVTARQTYVTAVEEVQSNLKTAFETAIEATDDEVLKFQLSRELEAGFDLARQQWTVLFRSSDSSHWTRGVQEGDNFAVDKTQFPTDIRSLRLRRMDTGAAVVIPMTPGQLIDHWVDRDTHIGWHGDHNSDRESNNTGVFRSDIEPPNDAPGVLAVSNYPGYQCIGWGFCTYDLKRRSPQRYSWNGKALGPTVFEIAVSPLPVDQVTPFSLRVDGPSSAMSSPSALSDDDPIVAELSSAKGTHTEAVNAAREKVTDGIAELIKELGAQGDASGIDKLIAARREFDEGDTVSEPSTKLRPRLTAFYGELDRADDALLSAYTKAVASFQRADKDDLAEVLQAEIQAGVGYEAKRWFVLFRSPDPRVWNTPSRGEFRFARSLTDAPEGTRYLRMRVIPNRSTRTKKLDPVIIEMTRQRIGMDSSDKGIGWNGTAKENNMGYHLGVYRLDGRVKWPFRNEFKGLIGIKFEGFDGHLGWGFGSPMGLRGQGYGWAGLTSSVPLEIEVAVTARPLRQDETKLLQTSASVLPPGQ